MSKSVEESARTQLETISDAITGVSELDDTSLILDSSKVVIALLLEILANQKRHLMSIGLETSKNS